MSVGELISYFIYFGGAFAAACAVIFAFVSALQVERRYSDFAVPALIPLIALGITLSTLLSKRDLNFASFNIELIGASAGGGGWLLRLLSFVIVGLSAAKVMGYLFKYRLHGEHTKLEGQALYAAFIAYFASNVLLNAAFGENPVFVHNSVYPLVIFSAAYLGRGEPIDPLIRGTKYALFAMMVLSLVFAIVKPQLVLQPNYKGWIPGLSIRLWGVGSHANSIGPLAILTLLLEVMFPARKVLMRAAIVISALAVLFLAQSKTALLAGIIASTILVWYRCARMPNGGTDIRFILMIVVVLLMLGLILNHLNLERIWAKIDASGVGGDITTLTGRTQIWAAAIAEWKSNPIFGYGLEAWGIEHRIRLGMQFAFSAHNQFLQSLSSAGTVGAAGLIAYLFLLVRGAFRCAEQTGGVSLALIAVILLRCVTETPLTLGTIFNGDFLTHFLIFVIVLRGQPTKKISLSSLGGLIPIKAQTR